MKFFVRFFVVVAILLVIGIGIYWFRQESGSMSSRLASALQAQPAVTPTPRPQATPDPANAQAERVDFNQLVRAAATANGVNVASIQVSGYRVDVTLTWQGDVATKGGDVLEALLNSGHLADFDEPSPSSVKTDRNGRKVYTAQFTLHMK